MTTSPTTSRWNPRHIATLIGVWFVLQIGGLFTPGFLDDVDSIYTEVAREMLLRHDYITPFVDGVRFFDKPPLMYWMAAASMRIFGQSDWAARLPLAISVLLLAFAVYALGGRFFREATLFADPDRGAFYSALAILTALGTYLYTRFYIPDILLALWMTLAVHLFLIALDRIRNARSALAPCLGFAAVIALNVLTKGLIGIIFPLAFVCCYLLITRQLKLLFKLHLIESLIVFLLIAAPWHILAAIHNPPIDLTAGLALPDSAGLPNRGGWAWFYLINEHFMRFLGRRIPHDYGQVPVYLFWLELAAWIFPWIAFLPAAITSQIRNRKLDREAAITLFLWPALVLAFFSLSSRQEYYSLPALPALALLAGGLLAAAECTSRGILNPAANTSALRAHTWFLLPLGTLIALIAAWIAITAPTPTANADLSTLLTQNPDKYNLALGHLYDLKLRAMGFFRAPLLLVAASMFAIGPIAWLLRRRGHTLAANLTLVIAMLGNLTAMHIGLVRFNPILGSKDLAEIINAQIKPGDLVIVDGELTSGSTLVFYTQQQVHFVNARINGLWFGSLYPDMPPVLETNASLHQKWHGTQRIFLLTPDPQRPADLTPYAPVHTLATSGGKTLLTNK